MGAGLLLRTVGRIHAIQPGYLTEHILRFDLVLPEARYGTLAETSHFFQQLEEGIGALPGVASVGSLIGAPLSRWNTTGDVLVGDRPPLNPGQEAGSYLRSVTPAYLGTVGMPVFAGRGVLPSDGAGSVPVALANEAFARQNFPDEDPLGKQVRITVDWDFGSPYWTIVGVVPDVRSIPGTGPLQASLPAEVRRLNPDLPLRNMATMRDIVAGRTASTRFYFSLLSAFATLAVVLAAVGLCGVVSFLVSRRRREIGIRLALGAERERVVRLVLRQVAVPGLLGLAAALATAWAGARALKSFLYEVEPRDAAVFGGVTVILLTVSLAASYLPARRACRVDPVETLRAD